MELKPCPFCGGKVYICYRSWTKRYVVCHSATNKILCPMLIMEMNDDIGLKSLADAGKAWNRRVENG